MKDELNDKSPIYKFLLATFRANPDYFIEHLLRPRMDFSTRNFVAIIREFVRNELELLGLPHFNDEVVSAFEKKANAKWDSISNDRVSSPFEFLKRYAEDILLLQNETPYFRISRTDIWGKFTFELGEDLFTTTFLADRSIKQGYEPSHFQWNYTLHSNFSSLNNMLCRKQINENHYHLFGSAPNADLSWLHLMNRPFGQRRNFRGIQSGFALEQQFLHTNDSFRQGGLHLLVLIAAYIRVKLFEECCVPSEKDSLKLGAVISQLRDIRGSRTVIYRDDMQGRINLYRYLSPYRTCRGEVVDYAIAGFRRRLDLGYIEIAGERHLYYNCLKRIFKYDSKSFDIQVLFYLYLLIKVRFNGTFIQKNNKYGFDNFHRYNSRRWSIISNTFYDSIAVKMATRYNINENYIQRLEARITPLDKANKLERRINEIDRVAFIDAADARMLSNTNESYIRRLNAVTPLDRLNRLDNLDIRVDRFDEAEKFSINKYFYVLHFVKNKKSDWGTHDKYKDLPVCRELELRRRIKKQSRAIVMLRRDARTASFRIHGIDAASHEVNCRPENFGQVFRYLSDLRQVYPYFHYDEKKKYLPDLHKTFHAGEDFYDIIDGLRAIDEAVLFLKLRQGDRIGHGVALGLDPEKYYSTRRIIAMPLQNALDNIAWILYCVEKFSMNISTSFYALLSFSFVKYYNALHQKTSFVNEKNIFTPSDLLSYIGSWKLRGDNPYCYRNVYSEDVIKHNLHTTTNWKRYNFVDRKKYKDIAINEYNLYRRYHFDFELKKAAEKVVEVEISDEYIELVKQIQVFARNFVLKKGVAIESNPSSNYLISSLDKTIDLPIFKMFPIKESESDFLRLNVSVNTDDQGVFYTSLVKEYTLLVDALQRETHANGLRK